VARRSTSRSRPFSIPANQVVALHPAYHTHISVAESMGCHVLRRRLREEVGFRLDLVELQPASRLTGPLDRSALEEALRDGRRASARIALRTVFRNGAVEPHRVVLDLPPVRLRGATARCHTGYAEASRELRGLRAVAAAVAGQREGPGQSGGTTIGVLAHRAGRHARGAAAAGGPAASAGPQPFSGPTRTTRPPQQSLTKLQFSRTARDRALANPGRGSDEPDLTMPPGDSASAPMASRR
jgi:hypothetical protein